MEKERINNLILRLRKASQNQESLTIDGFVVSADNCRLYANLIEEEMNVGEYIDDDFFETDLDILRSVQNIFEQKDSINMNRIKDRFNTAIINADLNEFDRLLSEICQYNDEDCAFILAKVISENYSSYNAGYLAHLLGIAIRKNMSWAQINNERNSLFRACLVLGSKDLYNCFIEETIPPVNDWYLSLYNDAVVVDEAIMSHYHSFKKGTHYNGCLKTHDNDSAIVQITRDDYIIIEEIVSRYNGIIERREIIEDLSNRAMCD